MNLAIIIGNLTKDPVLRTVNGKDGPAQICDFTVAVNKKETSVFFRCTAWRGLAEMIAKYARKGMKVGVSGPVTARAYTDNSGAARASLEIGVEEFEFCEKKQQQSDTADPSGMERVDEGLPF